MNERPQSVICEAGTLVLDYEVPGDYSSLPYKGQTIPIGPPNYFKPDGTQFINPPLEILRKGTPGGVANALKAEAAVGDATISEAKEKLLEICPSIGPGFCAVIAQVGDDEAGKVLDGMLDSRIDKSLLQTVAGVPTGVTEALVQKEKVGSTPSGERTLLVQLGINNTFIFTPEMLEQINPESFVNVSYPGLMNAGADQNNGENLSWFAEAIQKKGGFVSIDTHTPTKLEQIEKTLPRLDMFNANFKDAAKLFLKEELIESENIKEMIDQYKKMANIISRYILLDKDTQGRCKMFTITDRFGTYLIFKNAQGKIDQGYLPSSSGAVEATNTTGAGDVRYAIQRLCIAMLAEKEWSDGNLTWKQACFAVNAGQLAATLHVTRKENEPYPLEGVSLYALLNIGNNGQEYTTIEDVKRDLNGCKT